MGNILTYYLPVWVKYFFLDALAAAVQELRAVTQLTLESLGAGALIMLPVAVHIMQSKWDEKRPTEVLIIAQVETPEANKYKNSQNLSILSILVNT